MNFNFCRIIQTQIDARTNIENRLVNNDAVLQQILNDSMELIQNIRVLNEKELSNQRELEKQNTDGKRFNQINDL